MELGMILAVFGAALAVALAGIGSSIGIGYAAQASNGVMTEEPEKFTSLLILSVLPGTQGMYGFVVAFFVMLKVGLLGTTLAVTPAQGWQILGACLPVGLAGLFSGIHQGKVSASGVAIVAKQPQEFVKAVIFSALVETYAVLGLLITILLLMGIQVG
ncbi:MAG: V-type ATP synthase subunit K [Nitrospinota bacterium]|nr:V-type ATP synthase subunit K [Nitrospinota bacterium]